MLPRATQTSVVIDDSPYVAPLVETAVTRGWLVVLVDTSYRAGLHGNVDHVEEFERLEDPLAGRHERSGSTDFQRWVEHRVDQH